MFFTFLLRKIWYFDIRYSDILITQQPNASYLAQSPELFLTVLVFAQETVLTAQSRGTGEPVLVTVTLIREKSFGDPECVQFFNVLFNKMMKVLKYVRMKQSYFDPNRVSFCVSAIKWASFAVIVIQVNCSKYLYQ